MTLSFDRINTESGDWELYEVTPDCRRYRLEIEPGKFIIRTEWLATDDIIEENKILFNESDGQRWGDGKVAARVPLNVFYQQIAPRLKEGDEDYVKWFLNHESGKPFRTFKGRV